MGRGNKYSGERAAERVPRQLDQACHQRAVAEHDLRCLAKIIRGELRHPRHQHHQDNRRIDRDKFLKQLV